VSDPLARWYLDPEQVGTDWLLRPDSPRVAEDLRAGQTRGPDDSCDPDALIADLPLLLRLFRHRHIGLATGATSEAGLPELLEAWRRRLVTQSPVTWGTALGTGFHELRLLLRDNHVRARGEDRAGLLGGVDPRAAEPRGTAPAGIAAEETVTEQVLDGVLCLRVSSFGDDAAGERALTRWVEGRARHFARDRIVLDLRGNTGGNDVYARRWAADAIRTAGSFPSQSCWHIEGQPLVLWNVVVWQESVAGPDSVAAWVRRRRPALTPRTRLTLVDETDTYEAGASPWRGRMLVVTDRDTSSAAESATHMLRTAVGARIIGGRSAGMLCYGDVAPYLLPHSGLLFRLPARHTPAAAATELVGIPVDTALDPGTPISRVAADFDDLWNRSGGD